MINGGAQFTVNGATPGQVVLSAVIKQTEQVMRANQQAVLLHGYCINSCSRLECEQRVVKKGFLPQAVYGHDVLSRQQSLTMKGGSGLIAFDVLAEDLGLTASTHMALNVPGELTLPSELLEQQAGVQMAYRHTHRQTPAHSPSWGQS